MKLTIIGGTGLIGSKLVTAALGERSLIPAGDARLGEIRFDAWLTRPIHYH